VKYPALVIAAIALIAAVPQQQATPAPPPPPPVLTASAAPSGVPTASPSATPTAPPSLDNALGGKHRHGAPSATPTPPVDTRTGLGGVWEIQIQRGANTEYEHMNLSQTGDTIGGYYLTQDKKKYPISGVVDTDHTVRIIVSRPDGTTILLEAQVQDNTDMLGMFTDAKERVPFTAAYRPKEKFMDNVNAAPGGLGGIGGNSSGGGPPGGGP
jgi:hypothetical protein